MPLVVLMRRQKHESGGLRISETEKHAVVLPRRQKNESGDLRMSETDMPLVSAGVLPRLRKRKENGMKFVVSNTRLEH